jgi:hypothetical protein
VRSVTLSPRISRRLVEAIVQFDDRRQPIAETWRRVGAEAGRLGQTRPSYEQVRVLVHRARRIRTAPTTAEVLLDILWRVRSPEDLVPHLSGAGVRPVGGPSLRSGVDRLPHRHGRPS